MVTIMWTILLIPLIHELGHWLAARLFGSRLYFRFSWGSFRGIPIPRWTWYWPQGVTEKQLTVICQAGFLVELALIPFMPWTYQAAALAHFAAYPFYAGETSDFKGMV